MNDTTVSKLVIFDLDGLIIDSLPGLSEALLASFGEIFSSQVHFNMFRDYDSAHPGASRFEKLDFAFNLAGVPQAAREAVTAEVLKRFDAASFEARIAAEVDRSIFDFVDFGGNQFEWALVSNCDKNQLVKVSQFHGLGKLFGQRVFGTPPGKLQIVRELVSQKVRNRIPISVSDSQTDFEIAKSLGIEFALVTKFARDLEFNRTFEGLVLDSISHLRPHLESI